MKFFELTEEDYELLLEALSFEGFSDRRCNALHLKLQNQHDKQNMLEGIEQRLQSTESRLNSLEAYFN